MNAALSLDIDRNSDFAQRIVINTADSTWDDGKSTGIARLCLDLASKVGSSSSVNRYAPGTSFSREVNDGGEEIFVLEGSFSDEKGKYSAGTYLRNPPQGVQSLRSTEGCTLFVKTGHFQPQDKRFIKAETSGAQWYPGLVPGLSVMPLHDFDGVGTALVRWAPNTVFQPHVHPGGEEIFVLQGVFRDEHGEYPANTWIRSPRYSKHAPFTEAEGAIIYVKTGHIKPADR